ncbi:MAG: hypothetical protein LDL44_09365 [Caenispirillum sp.]|nr:hypothetical protein [Caenispirillum sp.]
MLTEFVSAGRAVVRAGAVAAVLLVAAAPAVQASGAAGCRADSHGPVETEVVLDPGRVVLDVSRDKTQLTTLFQGSDSARMTTGGWTTVGLTESSLEVRTATRTATWPAPGGGWCAQLQGARVEIGYPELRVYIPADFRPGSCAYATVHDHELEHVAITREVLMRHAPHLDRAVRRAGDGMGVRWAATAAEAKSLAAGIINAALAKPLEALRAEHRLRNAAIDTADNYHGLQARCDAW